MWRTALDWTQRRHQISSASRTPSTRTSPASRITPAASWWAIGPSMRALITRGIAIARPTPLIEALSMTTSDQTWGRRYDRRRQSDFTLAGGWLVGETGGSEGIVARQ